MDEDGFRGKKTVVRESEWAVRLRLLREGKNHADAAPVAAVVSGLNAMQATRSQAENPEAEPLCADCREETDFCACKPMSALEKVHINGAPHYWGRVKFTSPKSFRHVLNPFAGVRDEEGNRFVVSGLSGRIRAASAAKHHRAVDVVCRKRDDGFEIVRFGLDWVV